ncbi:unnamed protein product [Closterium sp. Naga37s-1]|nr:unnamed protein product [Closterium sp. Naga37s-1]
MARRPLAACRVVTILCIRCSVCCRKLSSWSCLGSTSKQRCCWSEGGVRVDECWCVRAGACTSCEGSGDCVARGDVEQLRQRGADGHNAHALPHGSSSVVSLRVGLRGGPCGQPFTRCPLSPPTTPPSFYPPSPPLHSRPSASVVSHSERAGHGGAEVEQRWSRGGAEVEQRWSRGGAEVEQRWSRGGAEVEQRWSRGGRTAAAPPGQLLPPCHRRGRHPWPATGERTRPQRVARTGEGHGGEAGKGCPPRTTATHPHPASHCHSPAFPASLPLTRPPPRTIAIHRPRHRHSPPPLRHRPHRSPAAMPASPAPAAAAARHALRLRGKKGPRGVAKLGRLKRVDEK